jgi:hypothetical protein
MEEVWFLSSGCLSRGFCPVTRGTHCLRQGRGKNFEPGGPKIRIRDCSNGNW